jgi:hypothetical protein
MHAAAVSAVHVREGATRCALSCFLVDGSASAAGGVRQEVPSVIALFAVLLLPTGILLPVRSWNLAFALLYALNPARLVAGLLRQ